MSVHNWSHIYDPAYALMLEANEIWNNDEFDITGDKKFLEACAIIYKFYEENIWHRFRSPVHELVEWTIDSGHEWKVKKLHSQTEFATVDGYCY